MAENLDLIRMATEGTELFTVEHEVLSSADQGCKQSELGIRTE